MGAAGDDWGAPGSAPWGGRLGTGPLRRALRFCSRVSLLHGDLDAPGAVVDIEP